MFLRVRSVTRRFIARWPPTCDFVVISNPWVLGSIPSGPTEAPCGTGNGGVGNPRALFHPTFTPRKRLAEHPNSLIFHQNTPSTKQTLSLTRGNGSLQLLKGWFQARFGPFGGSMGGRWGVD